MFGEGLLTGSVCLGVDVDVENVNYRVISVHCNNIRGVLNK